MKRISLMLRQDQYQLINKKGINLSGLVRDLIDDHFSENVVTVSVSEETKTLYEKIVSNTGCQDKELEVHLRKALKDLLSEKIDQMSKLQRSL